MSSPVGSHQLTDKEKRVILDAIAFLEHFYFDKKMKQASGLNKTDYEKLALINSVKVKWALGIHLKDS
ncbi:hypothetical protein CHH61_22320 [Shouchella clausii]|uniref:Uncharacterized protein n=1 Tax=Shouchella clausii TaxID=79880 RepID=A0A268RU10_SHOCL|nr:hypothetical protein [Shouchella clausii]PAF23748.1 hypothetical protein CHH61_22320 [Shouchella clausii]